VLALLPIVLLLASSYCALQYIRVFNRSVGAAVGQELRSPSRGDGWGTLNDSRGETTAVRSRGRATRRQATRSPRVDTVTPRPSTDSIRQYILRTATIEDIPFFTRLNLLYIGIFLCAEIALVLMALKEYAKEAMGLSERDLMLGSSSAPS
jgi:hypothetical protein